MIFGESPELCLSEDSGFWGVSLEKVALARLIVASGLELTALWMSLLLRSKTFTENLQSFPWHFPLFALTLLFECGAGEKFNSTNIYRRPTMFRALGQA